MMWRLRACSFDSELASESAIGSCIVHMAINSNSIATYNMIPFHRWWSNYDCSCEAPPELLNNCLCKYTLYKLLIGTLIYPIAATCSVGCVVVQLGVAVAGRQRRGLHAGTQLASLHCRTNSSVMLLLVRVDIAIFMVLWHVHLTSNSTSHAETIDQ